MGLAPPREIAPGRQVGAVAVIAKSAGDEANPLRHSGFDAFASPGMTAPQCPGIALRCNPATLAMLVAPVPLLHPCAVVLPVQEHGNGETPGRHRLR